MEPPIPPDEADCCNAGCNPCIFDVYEDQLRKYNARIVDLHSNYKNCISETSYTVFKLIDKIPHTKDTYFFIFEYSRPYRKNGNDEDKNQIKLYFKRGQHFLLRGNYNGSIDHFTRAYTPIPFNDIKPLAFCVLIKIYRNGLMSQYLKNLKISSETLWRGPYCDFQINYGFKHILMIAQGTGLAPLYAILKEMLANHDCETFIRLYFCCHNCDILLRSELYDCLLHWNFKYEIFLSDKDDTSTKYNEVIHCRKLNNEDIKCFLSDKNDDGTQVLICGSEEFNRDKENSLNDFDKVQKYIF